MDSDSTDRDSDQRKIFFAGIIFLVWSIAYGIIVLGENILQATILSFNTISNIISDSIVVIIFGLILVSFFLLSDFYIKLSIDKLAFVKIEFCFDQFNSGNDSISNLISNIIHFNEIKVSENPIPKKQSSAILFLSFYYIINILGMAIMTEILFLTIITSSNDFLVNNNNSIILPILSASLVVGGKIASFFYERASEYGNMLTETFFVFLLFGIVSSLHGASIPSYLTFIPGEQALQRYISILIYLAIIPVAIEVSKWLLWVRKEK
jgi:hypothetical protein